MGKGVGVGNSQGLADPDSILWNWGQRAGTSEPCIAARNMRRSLPIPGPGSWVDSMKPMVLARFPSWSPASPLRALIPRTSPNLGFL